LLQTLSSIYEGTRCSCTHNGEPWCQAWITTFGVLARWFIIIVEKVAFRTFPFCRVVVVVVLKLCGNAVYHGISRVITIDCGHDDCLMLIDWLIIAIAAVSHDLWALHHSSEVVASNATTPISNVGSLIMFEHVWRREKDTGRREAKFGCDRVDVRPLCYSCFFRLRLRRGRLHQHFLRQHQ
jgi:hypothetical protein